RSGEQRRHRRPLAVLQRQRRGAGQDRHHRRRAGPRHPPPHPPLARGPLVKRHETGVTLVELAVTLGLISVIVALGVGMSTDVITKYRFNEHASQVYLAFDT